MSNVYDEESQIEDLNVEADRVIAMNPSGVIENFEQNVHGKKVHCDGNKCVILGDDENDIYEDIGECTYGVCGIKNKSYSKYITYFIFFLTFIILCALAYYFYKKHYCAN